MVKQRPLASAEEVSQHIRVPVATLYQWRWLGKGPRGIKVGRHLRYRWDDVETWLDQQASVV